MCIQVVLRKNTVFQWFSDRVGCWWVLGVKSGHPLNPCHFLTTYRKHHASYHNIRVGVHPIRTPKNWRVDCRKRRRCKLETHPVCRGFSRSHRQCHVGGQHSDDAGREACRLQHSRHPDMPAVADRSSPGYAPY